MCEKESKYPLKINSLSFSYDANGNLLTKENAYKSEQYFYNTINRMAQSVVTEKRRATRMLHHCKTSFGLTSNLRSQNSVSNFIKDDKITTDAFGRRNLVQDQGSSTMRTLYDGFSFDIVQEAEVFQGGDFTTSYMEH